MTIGGLYWKRGTTGAAWAALLVGTLTAVGGFLLRQYEPHFPIHGQGVWAIGMGAAILAYVACALLNPKIHDLDRLLHRGEHALETEKVVVDENPGIGWRIFGMGKEFTRRDRVLYILTYAWTFLQIAVFVAGTVISLTIGSTNEGWLRYWQVYVWVNVVLSVLIIVWFGLGGIRDIGRMVRSLRTMRRDDEDDGVVRHETQ